MFIECTSSTASTFPDRKVIMFVVQFSYVGVLVGGGSRVKCGGGDGSDYPLSLQKGDCT